MNTSKILAAFAISAFLASCTATGPANDGFDLSQESLDIGSFLGAEALEFSVDRPRETAGDRPAITE